MLEGELTLLVEGEPRVLGEGRPPQEVPPDDLPEG